MDTWYSKQLGDGVAAFGPSNKIQESFRALIEAKSKTAQDYSDLAVFSRYDLHENVVTVYFSPNAELLARTYEADPCEKPTPSEGFALLVGDANSWETYFPGYIAARHGERC